MSDSENIPVQKDESREAFLRYLPKRIVAFEQRMQRYRREGWDQAGMAVLRGDLLRLGDASSHHGLLETCRHLLILARMVGEHVANMTAPDPQQAFRMFAQLSAVSESMPALGEHQDHPETGETTPETNEQHAAIDWKVEAAATSPVAEPAEPALSAAMEAIAPVEPIDEAELIEWVQAEPFVYSEPVDAADPVELVEPIAKQDVAEPPVAIEPIAERAESAEPIAPLPAESSADAEVAEAVAAGEQATPVQPPFQPEPIEAATHVDPAETVVAPTPIEAAGPAIPVEPERDAIAAPIARSDAVDAVEPFEEDEEDSSGEGGVRRVFYLSDGNAFAIDLGKHLESEGYAVEPVESVDELSEMLMCLMPQMLLVDASHMSDLDAIDGIRRDTQQRSQTQRRIQMVALAPQDDLEARRAAHRAAADMLLFPPFDIADILGRLRDLDTATEEQKVRVLVVDDERADALFAQTVLNRAGMQAHVEHDPMRVLETIKALHPDLVLMDLHMPFANGVEVTMLIREDPVFARLPIVFLSGESDPDSRLEAINAGGDDFLFKPIRPKNLIAAVKERMRRLHPVGKPAPAAGASDDPNGMQRRA